MIKIILQRIKLAILLLKHNSKEIFCSNIVLVIGLIPPLLFMYYMFGTAGSLNGNYEAKINEVRSLGDPRVFFPFTYMYAVSISGALLISREWKCKIAINIQKYLSFISKVAYDGILFFVALMTAQVIYFGSPDPIKYFVLFLFVVIPSAVVAAISGYEKNSKDYLSRFLMGLLILSSSMVLLKEVAEVVN